MPTSPEFESKLYRAIALFIQETKDGCVECQEERRRTPRKARKYACCDQHGNLFMDLAINPRKYIKL